MMKNLLDLDHKAAEIFFYRSESYYDGELPKYFHFTKMLCGIRKNFSKFNIEKLNRAKEYDNLHYDIYTNKDGKNAWRKLQLLNPILYVDLVAYITKKENWDFIIHRVKKLHEFCKENIICTSIPVVETRRKKNIKASQILEWWDMVEQNSIKHGIEYSYAFTTDITDCYPSIYTHTISWALHNKYISKNNRNNNLIGNIIDKKLQSMHYGQTNGIPQGSILTTFIAEILLAYIDRKIFVKLKYINKKLDYKIIRYRDDYKIFVNSQKDGELIIKTITDVLLDFNLKLNPTKTKFYDDIILASIKEDKYRVMQFEHFLVTDNIQKNLINVHKFLHEYPCSKQMIKILIRINDAIVKKIHDKKDKIIKNQCEVLVGICTQIAFKNPALCIPMC